MSDSYHYEDGAKHYDHKKVLHIDKVQGADLQQLMRAFFKDDVEEAEVLAEQATESRVVEEVKDETETYAPLNTSRQEIMNQLLALADKGDWRKDCIGEQVKSMLKTVLGQGETPLKGNEAELSATFWKLLESGRSERLRVTWQNLVGYFDDSHLLKQKTAPALNMDFFGDKTGSDNINKGRPSRDNMSSGFREILPLLDAYVPKVVIKREKCQS